MKRILIIMTATVITISALGFSLKKETANTRAAHTDKAGTIESNSDKWK